MDDLVEIIRQPILVFRQRTEAFLRSLKFADFARNIGVFEGFCGFCRFRAKILCREHGALLPDTRRADFRSTVVVVSVCRMLLTLYRDDQGELRWLWHFECRGPRG